MARRNKHSLDEIKAMVLAAAEDIIVEQGGSALTVRKIAMRVGYTVGSVYMVFENMADVVRHVNVKTLDEISGLFSSPQQNLQSITQAYVAYIGDNYHRWRLFLDTKDEEAQPSGPYQAKVDNLLGLIALKLPATNSPAQNKLLAQTLWASIQGVCSMIPKGDADKLKEAENSLKLLVKLLCVELD